MRSMQIYRKLCRKFDMIKICESADYVKKMKIHRIEQFYDNIKIEML